MRRWLSLLFCIVLVLTHPITATAHPGRTDSKGGHWNRSTGEYHYHHGYGPHDHKDLDGDGIVDCPYDFNYNKDRPKPNAPKNTEPEYEFPDFTIPEHSKPTQPTVNFSYTKDEPDDSSEGFIRMFFFVLIVCVFLAGKFVINIEDEKDRKTAWISLAILSLALFLIASMFK